MYESHELHNWSSMIVMSGLQEARQLLGNWYTWGGDNPLTGHDCSGYVCNYLKAIGLFPRGSRYNADMLFHSYRDHYPDYLNEKIRGSGDWLLTSKPQPDRRVRRAGGPSHREILVGSVVFYSWAPWLDDSHVSHTEIALNPFQAMGAMGGGSDTTTREKAAEQNAYIKLRPIRFNGLVGVLDVPGLVKYLLMKDAWPMLNI